MLSSHRFVANSYPQPPDVRNEACRGNHWQPTGRENNYAGDCEGRAAAIRRVGWQ